MSRVAAPAARVLIGHPVARILASLVLIQGSLFVSGTLVVRAIGVESRGELALLSGVVAVCTMFGLQGLPAAVLYFVASRDLAATQVFRLLRRDLLLRVVLVSFSGVGVLLVLGELSEPLQDPLGEGVMVFVGIAVLMVGFVLLAGVQGEERYTEYTVFQAIPPLTYAVGVAALFFAGSESIVAFLVVNSIGWAVLPLVAAVVFGREGHRKPSPALPTVSELRRFGSQSWLASASPTDMLGVEQLLIGTLLGHAALGLFVIGWAFETGTLLPSIALAAFVGPRIASAATREKVALAWRWVWRGLALALVTCAVLQAVLPPLLVFAFGEDARGAIGPARILVFAGVFLGLRRMLAASLQALDRPQWSTRAELFSFPTVVVSVVVLGLVFGLEGSCWGMVLGGIVGSCVQIAMLAQLGRASD